MTTYATFYLESQVSLYSGPTLIRPSLGNGKYSIIRGVASILRGIQNTTTCIQNLFFEIMAS